MTPKLVGACLRWVPSISAVSLRETAAWARCQLPMARRWVRSLRLASRDRRCPSCALLPLRALRFEQQQDIKLLLPLRAQQQQVDKWWGHLADAFLSFQPSTACGYISDRIPEDSTWGGSPLQLATQRARQAAIAGQVVGAPLPVLEQAPAAPPQRVVRIRPRRRAACMR